MNRNTLKKILISTLGAGMMAMISWMYPGTYFLAVDNDFTRETKKKLAAWNEKNREDKIYLQLDKTFYAPGETIWFSGFVRDAGSLKPSSKSEIMYADLLNPKGAVVKTIKLLARGGVSAGDFQLDDETPGGIYKIRAYTQWQKNFDPNGIAFEREFQVQDVVLPRLKMKIDFAKKAYGPGDEVIAKLEVTTNENKPLPSQKIKFVGTVAGKKHVEETVMTGITGVKELKFKLPENLKTTDGLLNVLIDYEGQTESVSRSIPIVLNNISLNFFPEGGDMISGLPNRVAFKATNEFGKPADIDGKVIDNKGNVVCSFSSFHFGMGAFNFIPESDKKYHVQISRPEGIKGTYNLPEQKPEGFVLSLDQPKTSEVEIKIFSTVETEASLMGQTRGKSCFSTGIKLKKGENRILIPASKFPTGVAQFTLFDQNGVEQAERLIFLNKNKKLNVKIIPEKDKYMPREEVVATIQVTDEFGNPTSADLFVSAVNDQLLSFADDKSGNLISKMLLESELQEKVEEPKFYFDPKEPKADKALDYLMMTSGWRRFTWGKVLAESQTNLYHQGELAVVSGVVRDAYTGKPVANANIKFTSNGNVFKTDNNGRFIFNKLDLYEPQAMVFSGENYSPSNQSVYYYNQNLNISLVPTNYKYPKSGGLNIKSSSVLDDFDVIAPMEQNLAAPEMERSVNVVQMKHDKSSEKRMEKKEAPKFQAPQAPPVDKVPSKDQNGKSANGKVFMDERFMPQGPVPMQKKKVHGNVGLNKNSQSAALYRAREFQTPKYSPSETPELRDDFRSTVFWKPNLKIDESGKGKIRFSTSDEITSFRLTAGGISGNGLVGQDETLIYNQLPFTLATKVPVEVTTGDKISIPVTIKNNTLKPISGVLKVKGPQGFLAIGNLPEYQQIPAGKAKTIYLNYDVLQEAEMGDLSLTFVSCGMNEGVKQKVNVVKAGYPVAQSFNGNKLSEEFHLDLRKAIKGSLKVKLSAFPSVVGDIMSGLSGILREPSGCFEQTSMSSWPNTMVLDYTKTMEVKDKELENRAAELLKKGYSRLVTFETPNKGYEWFGKAPAHEGLTAYGLLQFSDMSKAGADIDKQMMDRTTSWLLAQRDNEGGFQRNSKAYHAFGQIAPEIMNGYIVYALSETGMKDMKKEVDKAFKLALDNKDPYQLAMVSIALGNLGDNARAEKALEELKSQQKEDGSFPGKIHSITHSTGVSLSIETTALSVLALIKNNQRGTELNKAIKFISSSRNSYGTFGNTQGTVLALKALTEYAKASKATKEGGTVEVYVNGKKVDEVSYKAGDQGPLEINNLEKHLKEEKEKVTVKFKNTQNPLPVTLSVEYATNDPESSNECKVGLDVKVLDHSVNQGETVRLKAVVTNREKTDLPSTMVLIGLPAGLSAQPWQLKELQEKNVFDYYEIIGNKLALYYRGMAPSGKQEINLDLKAEVPGVYEAPASSAYLYYTNEFKTWTNYGKITVNKSN